MRPTEELEVELLKYLNGEMKFPPRRRFVMLVNAFLKTLREGRGDDVEGEIVDIETLVPFVDLNADASCHWNALVSLIRRNLLESREAECWIPAPDKPGERHKLRVSDLRESWDSKRPDHQLTNRAVSCLLFCGSRLHLLNQCLFCRRWFFAKKRGAKYHNGTCRSNAHLQFPDAKARRRELAKERYEHGKDDDAELLRTARRGLSKAVR